MSDKDVVEVYVLRWRYRDRSGDGSIRAYQSASKAAEDRDFMTEHADGKEWYIDTLPLIMKP